MSTQISVDRAAHEQMQAEYRKELDRLEAQMQELQNQNNKLSAQNEELAGELEVWRPTRVQVTEPQDNRKPADFVKPVSKARQFKVSEIQNMSEYELIKAVRNHMEEQLPNLKLLKGNALFNLKATYVEGLYKAVKGHKNARIQGFRDYSSCFVAEHYGFVPFVGSDDLKAHVYQQ